MRFLNVYPKRLFATLNSKGVFEGQFVFNLEQYGLLLSDTACDVTISEDAVMPGVWKIWLKPILDVDMPHFVQFEKAFNHYVFEVLQCMPNRIASGKDLPSVKLFFDGIYFDMTGAEPVIQKMDVTLDKK